MATIVFYEKPGCSGNARQKQRLKQAGHTVVAYSLLATPWTGEKLLEFFGSLPVREWFNPAAPRVKAGQIDPSRLDRESALGLLLAEPLLIRRPLMEIDQHRLVGFDPQQLHALIGFEGGLGNPAPTCSGSRDTQGCHGGDR
jgi:nitrogenase-associated protein